MYLRANKQGEESDTVLERSESQSRLTNTAIIRTVEYEISSEPADLH